MSNLSNILTSPLAKEAGKALVISAATTAGSIAGLFAGGLAVAAVQERKNKKTPKPEEA